MFGVEDQFFQDTAYGNYEFLGGPEADYPQDAQPTPKDTTDIFIQLTPPACTDNISERSDYYTYELEHAPLPTTPGATPYRQPSVINEDAFTLEFYPNQTHPQANNSQYASPPHSVDFPYYHTSSDGQFPEFLPPHELHDSENIPPHWDRRVQEDLMNGFYVTAQNNPQGPWTPAAMPPSVMKLRQADGPQDKPDILRQTRGDSRVTKRKKPQEKPTIVDDVVTDVTTAPASKFACEMEGCASMFRKKEHLKRHYDSVHSNIKIPCPFCSSWVNRYDNFRQHIWRHTQKSGKVKYVPEAIPYYAELIKGVKTRKKSANPKVQVQAERKARKQRQRGPKHEPEQKHQPEQKHPPGQKSQPAQQRPPLQPLRQRQPRQPPQQLQPLKLQQMGCFPEINNESQLPMTPCMA